MLSDWGQLESGEHRISLVGGAGVIEAIVHIPKGFHDARTKAVAICCHPHPLYEGSMTNKVVHTLAKTFSKLGLVSIRFNFRGVGRSEGKHDNTIGESTDVVLICQQVIKRFPKAQIWLSGFSFGSFIAANVAHEVNAAQLISISPAVEHYDFTEVVDPGCPWLVVMGDEDDIVTPSAVDHWINMSPERYDYFQFPDTGHFYHGKLVKLSDLLLQQFQPVVEAI